MTFGPDCLRKDALLPVTEEAVTDDVADDAIDTASASEACDPRKRTKSCSGCSVERFITAGVNVKPAGVGGIATGTGTGAGEDDEEEVEEEARAEVEAVELVAS